MAGLEVTPFTEYAGQTSDMVNKLMQTRLNYLYGGKERESQFQKSQMQNAFYPMQQAISAQNALSYSNMRSNPAGDYLRAISNMPSKQRELYLSYPENQKKYQEMINMAQHKMQNPASQQNFIQPEMVNALMKQFMPQGGGQSNGQLPMGIDQQGAPANAQQPPVMPMQPPQQPQQPPVSVPEEREPKKVEEIPDNLDLENAHEALPPITSVDPAIAMQYQQNLQGIDNNTAQRLSGAVVLDKYLMDNRKQINDSINAASKYASYWGMGAKKKDEFLSSLMNKDPKGYTDLKWYESAFIPHISNSIKVMEKLSSTNSQREELHEMSDSIINHKINSKQAKELFNKQIKTLMDLSDAVIQSGEPFHKGVTRNIFDMPKLKGNYLNTEEPKAPATGKGYSKYLNKPILDLIESGGLTDEYYRNLTPEQRKAARKVLEAYK